MTPRACVQDEGIWPLRAQEPPFGQAALGCRGACQSRLVDADLGGGLIKQRVARPGQGRSGGFRTIVAFRSKERGVFLYGFAKSGRDNLEDDELAAYKSLVRIFLELEEDEVRRLLAEGELKEVKIGQDV